VRPPAGARLAEIDEIEVVVEQLVSGGEGLARFEGIPLFVPLSAPGDRLRVRLVERRPHYGRAEILEILEPGPARRDPPCPHFGECGGCDLQHLEDEAQTPLKAEAVRETLQRLAGIRLPADVRVVAGDSWQYRLRTQVHAELSEAGARVGYRRRRSHELVAVESCRICRPELESAVVGLAKRLAGAAPRRLDLAVGDTGVVTTAPVVPELTHGQVEVSVGEFEYAFDARCFFQAHRGLLAELVDSVVGDWSGEQLFDLYGGVGLFALPGSRKYEQTSLVEGDSVAARYARINARRNRVRNLEVRTQAVESWIVDLPQGADRVIVDPPRAGLSNNVRQRLLEQRPRRLTYVSCHPAALARDLKLLRGSYEIGSVALLDLFPQTSHIEVVVHLE
jgi:23S rRNA (uracil1939-C5)-methyltransferase